MQVAGDPERIARHQRSAEGIPIPDTLMQQLQAIATRAHVPFSLDTGR